MTATVASGTRLTMARVTVVLPEPVPPAMPMKMGRMCRSRSFGAAADSIPETPHGKKMPLAGTAAVPGAPAAAGGAGAPPGPAQAGEGDPAREAEGFRVNQR